MEEVSAGVKVARGFLYIFSRVVIVALVIAALIISYDTAVNTMTVDMVIKDAFAKRAQTVLMPNADGSDQATLEKLFTAKALSSDNLLNHNPYKSDGYTITGYYERTDVSGNIVWSWENAANVRVTEIVRDIKALSHMEPDENGETPMPPIPEWESGTYNVRVVKQAASNSWMIDSIEFESGILVDMVAPATESASPSPEASASMSLPESVAQGIQ